MMMYARLLLMPAAMACLALPVLAREAPLSASLESTQRLVDECDRLAAHPDDPDTVTDGVSQSSMDKPNALAACRAAVQAAPDNGRVRYQYARVLFYLGENEMAVKEMQQSADLGHVQAQYIFGTFIVRGRTYAPTDLCLAERYWREAAAGGRQAARVQYLRFALQSRFSACDGLLDDSGIEATYKIASSQAKDFYERLVLEDIRASLDRRLPDAARVLWERCAATLAVPVTQAVRVRRFGDTPTMTSALNGLIMSGEKTITATTPWLTAVDPSRRGFPGAFWVVVDADSIPQGVLRTTEIKQTRFDEVTEADSQYEGKPVRPIEAWRKVHRDFFDRVLQPLGKSWSTDMPVTLERFEVICRSAERPS
jgi:uncharacterized protein YhfF